MMQLMLVNVDWCGLMAIHFNDAEPLHASSYLFPEGAMFVLRWDTGLGWVVHIASAAVA